MRSIFPESVKVPRSSPRWSSCGERSEPNETSKRRGTSCRSEAASSRRNASRSRRRPCSSSTPLQVGQLHPNAGHRLAETLAHEAKRIVELVGPELLDAEPLGDAREELVQRAMGDLAAQAGIDDLVDRARADQPVDEPDRRAVGKRLQLGDAEVRFLRNSSSTSGCVRRVGRSKARSARSSGVPSRSPGPEQARPPRRRGRARRARADAHGRWEPARPAR